MIENLVEHWELRGFASLTIGVVGWALPTKISHSTFSVGNAHTTFYWFSSL